MSIKNPQESRWESGELGLSAENAVAAPVDLEQEVDQALSMQPISIRLPKRLIDDLKLIANKESLGYQPLVRRVLLRFAAAEFRHMAHEKLTASIAAPTNSQESCEQSKRSEAAYGT